MASNDVSLFSVIEDNSGLKEKAPNALRTISEASELLDIPQHVLRFWETKFVQIKPLKRNGGRRFYRPQDLDVLQQIKHLLYSQGYTIKGAQKAIADYVAARASQKHEVVQMLTPSFPPAHGNDNAPINDIYLAVEETAEPVDVLAEIAQALNDESEQFSFAPQGPTGISREEAQQLRDELAQLRDELAGALAA